MKLNKVEVEIIDYLTANAGKPFDSSQLSKHFGVSLHSIRTTLNSLGSKGKNKIMSTVPRSGATQWYVEAKGRADVDEPWKKSFKPLSAANIPSTDYELRRRGSTKVLRSASKFI